MNQASIATLKSKLSHYVSLAQEGETTVVTHHQRPVAKLIPYNSRETIAIRPPPLPANKLRALKGVRPRTKIDPLLHLLADRSKG